MSAGGLDRLPAPAAPTAAMAGLRARLRDLAELTKLGITSLVLCTTAGGLYLAPGRVDRLRALAVLVTTMAVVSAANALNQYLERDIDRFMVRTRNRPLPARRLDARVALAFGLGLALVSVPLLTLAGGWLTGLLALVALASYVLVYTPLKQTTPLALFVGAIPGALPPLLGWTTVTGRLDPGGLALFGILFVWQIPHFLAVALYRRDDYARAGLKVMPVVVGEARTRVQVAIGAAVLFAMTLLPYALGLTGRVYLAVATLLGAGFAIGAARGLSPHASVRWSRRLFLASIVHLTLLFTVLMLDAVR